jgi:hypothetical protein
MQCRARDREIVCYRVYQTGTDQSKYATGEDEDGQGATLGEDYRDDATLI